MSDVRLVETVDRYARSQADYGGRFVTGDVLTVLFTGDTARHDVELRAALTASGLAEPALRVAATDRTWAAIQLANATVTAAVTDHPAVTGVGITVLDGRFVVRVDVARYRDEIAADLTRLADPQPILIRERTMAVRL